MKYLKNRSKTNKEDKKIIWKVSLADSATLCCGICKHFDMRWEFPGELLQETCVCKAGDPGPVYIARDACSKFVRRI